MTCPSAVGSTRRLVRRKTVTPSSSSSRRICWETADCVRKSSSPAFVSERCWATATIVRRWRSSMARHGPTTQSEVQVILLLAASSRVDGFRAGLFYTTLYIPAAVLLLAAGALPGRGRLVAGVAIFTTLALIALAL